MIPPSASTEPMRLSNLTALIADAVNTAFRNRSFWVVADVTNHSLKAEKRYHYFDLVEKAPDGGNMIARLSAVAWGEGTAAIDRFQAATGQPFTNNINVLVNVSVQYHPVYGLQLVLNQIDPNFTLGVLEKQRQATLEKLVRENPDFVRKSGDVYLTKNKSLPLNPVIQHIAVVCSSSSAGWQDFKHTLDTNPYQYHFVVDPYFTAVQGEANIQQFVDSLVEVFRSANPYDAVVIIRGGGAQTDFLIFDHYLVGKAVAKFPIPIITGIGHQKNETIADLMAHQATKTPTQAAELIINHNHAFEDALITLQKNIIIKSQQHFSIGLQSLSRLQSIVTNCSRTALFDQSNHLLGTLSALSTKPRLMVSGKIRDIQQQAASIKTVVPILLKNENGYLNHNITMIKALSPENTLRRGFAVIKIDGWVTSDPNRLSKGKDVEIIFARKSITATVKSKKDYSGTDFNI
jgi:exodeoxyribonuclease VII large subunit